MPIRSKITDNSFTRAIFKSRCVFSITFAASATLIELALCVPAVMMLAYKESTISAISGVLPLVIFLIFVSVFTLSPGLIRSGLYPAKSLY